MRGPGSCGDGEPERLLERETGDGAARERESEEISDRRDIVDREEGQDVSHDLWW